MTPTKKATKRAPKRPAGKSLPEAPPVNPVDDGIDYESDGTVNLRFAGRDHVLVAPLLKDYRDIKAVHARGVEGFSTDVVKLAQIRAGLAKKDATQEEIKQLSDDAVEFAKDVVDPVDRLTELYDVIFERLCAEDVDPGTYPVWLVENSETALAIFNHWRTVPLGLGG